MPLKNARRICPILSTVIIPSNPSRPTPANGREHDETSEGSRLDAKTPLRGYLLQRVHNDSTLVLAIETEPSTSWVLAAQVPGLPS